MSDHTDNPQPTTHSESEQPMSNHTDNPQPMSATDAAIGAITTALTSAKAHDMSTQPAVEVAVHTRDLGQYFAILAGVLVAGGSVVEDDCWSRVTTVGTNGLTRYVATIHRPRSRD